MVRSVGGAAAIFEQQTFEPAVIGLAHRRVNTDIGGDAGQHQVGYAAQPQHQTKIGGVERALAGLVDDRLAGERRQFGYDLPAGLAAHQEAAAGALVADARRLRRERQRLLSGRSARSGRWPSRVWKI
jgi:hypothetical protein